MSRWRLGCILLNAVSDDRCGQGGPDDIAEDALNSMRFLPGEVTNAIETSLARVYDVDADELAELLFPED